ncbi:epididymal secretory protein E3-beta [Heterocephalus glaber]|uniref:Epididymal secretory protein E3-beta n=1 Tax=Heterocephalus glaber TaxID=10181 RepID=A0AAX6QL12_HETGA|nr:epididymal secretory protein E3-beta [Heterocephalus glaber]
MTSSLKVWGILLTLLGLQCRLLAPSKDISRQKFMEDHHLCPSQEFSAYKCDFLLNEREAVKHKILHLFIYISWYKVEHICYSSNRNDHNRNVYVWPQVPIKVLKCHWESFTNSYRESRSSTIFNSTVT